MLDLALHYGEGPVLLKDIAKRQEVSEKYLWQLIDSLKIAGLINSVRGAHGGYNLAKSPSEITLNDIVTATEGDLYIVECVGNRSVCQRSETCATRDVWDDIYKKISETLKTISLQDMVNKQNSKI